MRNTEPDEWMNWGGGKILRDPEFETLGEAGSGEQGKKPKNLAMHSYPKLIQKLSAIISANSNL